MMSWSDILETKIIPMIFENTSKDEHVKKQTKLNSSHLWPLMQLYYGFTFWITYNLD